MIASKVAIDENQISAFCHRWKITEFSLFGSALRDDFQPESSDIDVLISFAPDAHWTLFDWADMEDEIQQIFQRKVDLISRRGLERSRNQQRRQAILDSAQIIYAMCYSRRTGIRYSSHPETSANCLGVS
ncbi:MAG: DNA polymerase subunit beta [Oscillatoriales cyanobacterium]|nr:MAG: DNA polymerase subunit beta [Oscillatoriales cyanobacterium]